MTNSVDFPAYCGKTAAAGRGAIEFPLTDAYSGTTALAASTAAAAALRRSAVTLPLQPAAAAGGAPREAGAVQLAVLDLGQHAAGQLEEGRLHVLARLGRRLHVRAALALREAGGLDEGHLPLLQIALVAHDQDGDVRPRLRLGIGQPLVQLLVAGAVGQREDGHARHCAAVVAARHAPESVLPGLHVVGKEDAKSFDCVLKKSW